MGTTIKAMDSARCLCHIAISTAKIDCPIHGQGPVDPTVPYVLNLSDRKMLKSFGISTKDPSDIDDTYRSDLKERR